ncbi:ABC-F family ATP-binding cassette domain-containing protein [Patescibacteria group bacterium]
MIIAKNIMKSYSGTPVLDGINLKLGNNNKVALVGRNGCGKSTLIKILAGELISDEGSVTKDGERIAYIPQEFEFPNVMLGEYLEGLLLDTWDFYKVEKLLNDLEFKNYDEYQLISTLSDGQKMKVKVLEALLEDPTTLLIDEPTNHLDIEGILWFENYIEKLSKTVLMISHDREFLNHTVKEIWEIDNKKLISFAGNYDFYKEEKLKLIDKWDDEYTRFIKRKNQLEELLIRARRMKISRKGGTSQVKSRIKREVENKKVEKHIEKNIKKIDFGKGVSHPKLMVKLEKVEKRYDQNIVFNDLNLEIRGGEKIWLFGPNGSGKTTLVKLLVGLEKISKGGLRLGKSISIGYFAQNQAILEQEKKIITYFMDETGCSYEQVFGELRNYLFEKDDLKKRIKSLSPGQRARFAFAVFAYKKYDMLILDEPGNHLDISTKEVLEESLKKSKGTLLLISHDRYFIEKVGVTKVLNLKDGVLKEY